LVPIIVSTVISTYYFLNENFVLGSGFLLIGIFVPLNNTLNTYGAFLQGKKDFRANYLYGLGWNLPFYAVMIFASFFFKIALVLLFANLISQAIGLFIVYKRTLRVYKPDTLVDRSAISYGKHLSAMGWFGAIVTQIDMVFAFHYLGAVDLAIYSFATAIPERLSSLLKFLPSAALPKLSEKSPDEVRSALGKRVWIVIFGAAVLTVVYIVFAPFIFHYLFPTYEAAIKYSQIYAFMIIASISGLFSTALTAQGNIRGLYFFNIGSSVIQLIIQLVGAAFFGLIGLVFAKLASSFISFALSIILLYSKKQHITTPS
jgi:O-antigen/teichoic acid export membrane protein